MSTKGEKYDCDQRSYPEREMPKLTRVPDLQELQRRVASVFDIVACLVRVKYR